ncbi:zinc-binding dehydrogenase, partial [Actinoplanes sp. NPDC051633]|uniref:zinc-dependent alcohol dehydrogenase n=1 Tax=Actinoplanes sp. NPDC051633 TaxID=3155670 RepID=UPI003429367D
QPIGQEMSGHVAAVGAGVSDWTVGRAVTVMPLDWCGACPACRAGHQHVCQRLTFIGIDSPGALQSRWTVPARVLVALPPDLPMTHGALVEPTAVAVHDVRRGGVRPGEHVVVVGGGPVGTLIALVSQAWGAQVVVSEPDNFRRTLLAGLGLSAVDPIAVNLADFVEEWTGGAGAAVAFEVSGSPAGIAAAVGVLAVRGRLVVVGIHARPPEVDLHRVFWRELTLVGARVYERADFDTAVEIIHRGDVPAEQLISRILPLADAADAFTTLTGGGVMKVLIDCAGQDR